ncbi:zf-HC2 domain-containing protein [Streptomyces albofaciens JCM 4342]|uniref:zf-HC2 domain-containing protein n=1 Tax=Streptomyces albofaciens TaxID=66866 RepID=UPI0012394575|nr:zf-HC2 domain-containing protein [Streptomyces albofaciens]KAA6222122.1 zf-HC2 domain-containing protein [Streptomyces albofaciens JCM 4342]
MQCSRVRTALSARLDGEQLPPGITGGQLDAHVAGCVDCRRWSAGAARLQRLIRAARAADGEGERP